MFDLLFFANLRLYFICFKKVKKKDYGSSCISNNECSSDKGLKCLNRTNLCKCPIDFSNSTQLFSQYYCDCPSGFLYNDSKLCGKSKFSYYKKIITYVIF